MDDVYQTQFRGTSVPAAYGLYAVRFVSWIVAALLILSGTAFAEVQIVHYPLFKSEPHDSIIIAATRMDSTEIQLTVIRGEMTQCNNAGKSNGKSKNTSIPCRKNATEFVHKCAGTKIDKCSYRMRLTNDAIVTYWARMRTRAGDVYETDHVTYSGGAFSNKTLARPVYWHADPKADTFQNKLDLAIYPDTDYNLPNTSKHAAYVRFADDLSRVLTPMLFDTSEDYSELWAENKEHFNLWTGPFGANATKGKCTGKKNTRTCTCPTRDLKAVSHIQKEMNGGLILHTEDFETDCANFAWGHSSATGTVDHRGYSRSRPWPLAFIGAKCPNEWPDGDWVLVHEGAHLLFGLADEYEGAGQVADSTPKNVFADKRECKDTAILLNIDERHCEEIKSSRLYRIYRLDDTRDWETMECPTYKSKFHDASRAAVLNRFEQCKNGACY